MNDHQTCATSTEYGSCKGATSKAWRTRTATIPVGNWNFTNDDATIDLTIVPRVKSSWSINYGAGWRQIHRFFESRIGQQWSKVWAEFCGKASVWWMPRDTIGNGDCHAW